jgi:hypothetical protein
MREPENGESVADGEGGSVISAPSQAVIPTEVDQSLFLLDGRINTLSMFAACGSLVSASGRAVRVDAVQARRYTLRPHSDTSKAYLKLRGVVTIVSSS